MAVAALAALAALPALPALPALAARLHGRSSGATGGSVKAAARQENACVTAFTQRRRSPRFRLASRRRPNQDVTGVSDSLRTQRNPALQLFRRDFLMFLPFGARKPGYILSIGFLLD
jgi:hypothetical protein